MSWRPKITGTYIWAPSIYINQLIKAAIGPAFRPDLTTNDKLKQQQEESGGLSVDNTSAENHCTIFTIAESPLDENLIFAGTDDGNLQITNDAGKYMGERFFIIVRLQEFHVQTWVSSIEPSHFSKDILYATFDNHMYGDHKTYLGKSTDGGKTWTMMKSPGIHRLCS